MPPLVDKENSGTSVSAHLSLPSILEYKPKWLNMRSGEREDHSRFPQDLEILLRARDRSTKPSNRCRAVKLTIIAEVYPENFLRERRITHMVF